MSDARAESSIDWTAALARHDRWLRTVALARLGCRDAVDEVMQEVALAVFRKRSPLLDQERLAPWLYRLTVYQSLMHLRTAGRRRRRTDNLSMGYREWSLTSDHEWSCA